MLFFRLCNNFAIRGWKKTSGVLIKRPENQFKILDKSQLGMILLCDGVTDFSKIYSSLSLSQKNLLKYWTECGIIEKTNKRDPISKDGAYCLYGNRFFPSFLWSITGRCNCKCKHCYVDGPSGMLGEPTLEEAKDIIDQIEECGGLKISLTGGEPFIRQDIWEIIDYILSKKICIDQIYTNGILLNKDILNNFIKRNIKPDFVISYDGFNRHDWLRGIKGAEEKTLNAIKLCNTMGFNVMCEMCIHRGNLDTLPETVRLLGEYNISALKISGISDTPLWLENNEGNQLTFKEYVDEMIKYIPKFFEDGMPCNLIISSVISLGKHNRNFNIVVDNSCSDCNMKDDFLCGALRNMCYIRSDGMILPCMPMSECSKELSLKSLKSSSLKEILSDSVYMSIVNKRLDDLIKENEECRLCPYILHCKGGCRAMALTSGNGIMGKDPNACFLWKNNYPDKIRKVAMQSIEKYCCEEEKNED